MQKKGYAQNENMKRKTKLIKGYERLKLEQIIAKKQCQIAFENFASFTILSMSFFNLEEAFFSNNPFNSI